MSILTHNPPRDWFDDPKLDAPTPITITPDGRIYGHAAVWGTCHVGIAGACVTPPRSPSGYAQFMLGARQTDKGDVPVGTITLGAGHAGMDMGGPAAKAHYENTGLGIADVAMGEDEWGPWFAGAVRRGATEEQVEQLRAAKISGDWRPFRGSLELVGLLAVNVPGFPVPRVRVAGGSRSALVAAGVVPSSPAGRLALVAGIEAHQRVLLEAELDALMLRVRMPELAARAGLA